MEYSELIPDMVRGFRRWVSTRRGHDEPTCEMSREWSDFWSLAEAHECHMEMPQHYGLRTSCPRWNVWRLVKDRLGLEETIGIADGLTTVYGGDEDEGRIEEFWTAVAEAYHASNLGSVVRGHRPKDSGQDEPA